jgi:hypothetical protein
MNNSNSNETDEAGVVQSLAKQDSINLRLADQICVVTAISKFES